MMELWMAILTIGIVIESLVIRRSNRYIDKELDRVDIRIDRTGNRITRLGMSTAAKRLIDKAEHRYEDEDYEYDTGLRLPTQSNNDS